MIRLKALRNSMGITQDKLAQKLSVSRSTVAMWETGGNEPDYNMLRKLSEFFGVSADFIIGAGAFSEWDKVIKFRDDVYEKIRTLIPLDMMMTEDDIYLVARLRNQMVSDFDEIATARWFSFAVSKIVISENAPEFVNEYGEVTVSITFTDEFQAIMDRHNALNDNTGFRVVTMQDAFLEFNDRHGPKSLTIPVLGRVAAGIPLEAVEDIIDFEEIPAALASTGYFFALQIRGDSMEPRMMEGDVVIVRKQEDADTGDTAIVLVNGNEATCKKIKKTPEGVMLIPTNPAHEPWFYTNEEIEKLPVKILGKVVELRAKY